MDLTYALTFSVVLCSLIMRFDFGDLPHLLILALAPWILMRWLFYQNIAPARWLRVITGLLAGLTACCDLPFAFFFVIVELALVLESGTWRKICSFSGEWLVFLSTALCYLIRLSQLPEPAYTAFWKWTMPLKLLNYAVYDSNLYGPNSCPDRRDLLYCLALALAFVFSLSKNRSSFAPIFSIMLSGFGLYILEKEGLSRDLAPVIFGCSAAFALTFLILGRLLSGLLPRSEQQLVKGFKYPALLMTSVIVTMFFGCSLNWDRDRLHTFIVGKESAHCDDLLTVYYADKIAVEPIMIMSDYPEAAYPALLNFDAHPIGYLLWARPLRLFDYAISKCLLTADLKDFYEYVCRQIRSDLQNRKVKHLLLQTYECDLLKRAGIFGSVASDYQFDKECLYYSLNRQPREFVGLPYFSHFVRKDR